MSYESPILQAFFSEMGFFSSLDLTIFKKVNQDWGHPLLDLTMPFITDFHKTPYFWIFIVPFILYVHKKHGWKGSFLLLSAVCLVGFLDFFGSQIIKPLFARPRPGVDGGLEVISRAPHFGGYSFLSNHATNMFGLAVYLGRAQKAWLWPLIILATAVAYSRVYVGVHYPSDVLGGALWGSAWAYLASHFYLRWSKKKWPEKGSARDVQ